MGYGTKIKQVLVTNICTRIRLTSRVTDSRRDIKGNVGCHPKTHPIVKHFT